MKWIIKNPAPIGPRLTMWGDYHFGRSLAKYLERLGEEVEQDYDPEWYNDKQADVVLVLRGKHRYEVPQDSRALHIMWNISHPEDVGIEEYNLYHKVFVASETHAERLRPQLRVPVEALMQCTDTEEFYPPSPSLEARRMGYIFVGNSRNEVRPGVVWAIELGLPLQIWGRMWEKFVPPRNVVGKFVPNEELGLLYQKSKVTLNDHWADMRESGFVNNRIFDALACGLPVISDYHEELARLFPREVLYYTDKSDLAACLREIFLNYPEVKHRVDAVYGRVKAEFSFEARARNLYDTARALKQAGVMSGV